MLIALIQMPGKEKSPPYEELLASTSLLAFEVMILRVERTVVLKLICVETARGHAHSFSKLSFIVV